MGWKKTSYHCFALVNSAFTLTPPVFTLSLCFLPTLLVFPTCFCLFLPLLQSYAAADMLCEHTGLHRCLLEKKNAGEEDGGSSSGGGVGGNGGFYLFPLLVNQMDRELPRKCVPLK
jgi:hypothetical protein